MPKHSRRDFGKVMTAYLLGLTGAIGLAGLVQFLEFEATPSRPTQFDLGLASDYPIPSRTRLDRVPAVLIRNSGGFTALSLVCTHLGCTVEDAAEGFVCPCHGSRYDNQGAVKRGPASQPLRALRTELTSDGRVILHTES